MSALILFVSTFVAVFALGAQSLFVNNGRYWRAWFNSLLIGICHILLYRLAPNASVIEIAAFLAGGPFGIVSAMWVFRHLHRRAV